MIPTCLPKLTHLLQGRSTISNCQHFPEFVESQKKSAKMLAIKIQLQVHNTSMRRASDKILNYEADL